MIAVYNRRTSEGRAGFPGIGRNREEKKNRRRAGGGGSASSSGSSRKRKKKNAQRPNLYSAPDRSERKTDILVTSRVHFTVCPRVDEQDHRLVLRGERFLELGVDTRQARFTISLRTSSATSPSQRVAVHNVNSKRESCVVTLVFYHRW